VFLTSIRPCADGAAAQPQAQQVLHQSNIILSIKTVDLPRVPADERGHHRSRLQGLHAGQARLWLHGDAERAKGWRFARKQGCVFEIIPPRLPSRAATHRFARPKMPGWQDQIFIALARNATRRLRLFPDPDRALVEVGTQVAV